MINDLASFRVTLASYMNRADMIQENLDNFIDNGRREASRAKAREQELTANLVLDANLSAPLPARFMAARALYTVAGVNVPQVASAFVNFKEGIGYRVVLDRMVLLGGGLVAGDTVQLDYYEYPSQLVADSDTNTFLLVNGDLWLWCAVKEGARFMRDAEMMQAAQAAVDDIGARIMLQATQGRQHGGPRVMRMVS